jgi:hypothetical protein
MLLWISTNGLVIYCISYRCMLLTFKRIGEWITSGYWYASIQWWGGSRCSKSKGRACSLSCCIALARLSAVSCDAMRS